MFFSTLFEIWEKYCQQFIKNKTKLFVSPDLRNRSFAGFCNFLLELSVLQYPGIVGMKTETKEKGQIQSSETDVFNIQHMCKHNTHLSEQLRIYNMLFRLPVPLAPSVLHCLVYGFPVSCLMTQQMAIKGAKGLNHRKLRKN